MRSNVQLVSVVTLFVYIRFATVTILFAANGSCKASEGDARVSAAICTDGYDSKILCYFLEDFILVSYLLASQSDVFDIGLSIHIIPVDRDDIRYHRRCFGQ